MRKDDLGAVSEQTPLDDDLWAASEQTPIGGGRHVLIFAMCAGSVAWFLAFMLYVVVAKSCFLRMTPAEFASVIEGWTAPLGMAWLAAAVFLQLGQLRSQYAQLSQSNAALNLQGVAFRRAMAQNVNESQRQRVAEAEARVERLSDYVLLGMRRVARIMSDWAILPYGRRKMFIGDAFGDDQDYVDFARNHDWRHAQAQFVAGLASCKNRLNFDRDQAIGIGLDELTRAIGELEEILRASKEIEREMLAADSVGLRLVQQQDLWRDVGVLGSAIESLIVILKEIERPYKELDDPLTCGDCDLV